MKNLRVIEASGSNYEIGFKIGKETKEEIKKVLETTGYVNLSETYEIKIAYKNFLSILKKKFPKYIEELQGMADGAEVEFRTLMKLNLPELKKIFKTSDSEHDQCTTFVLKDKDRVFIAHNEDGPFTADIFLLKVKLPSEIQVLTVCYYGVLMGFSATMTSKGLFYVCNALTCNDFKNEGIPKRFITRSAVESTSFESFVKTVTTVERSAGQNYIVYHKEKVYDVEVSGTNYLIKEIQDKFCHANHFILSEMEKYEGKKEKNVGSFLRYKVATEGLNLSKNEKDFIQILSSHQNRPSCLCSHGKETGDLNKTLGLVLFDSSKKNQISISKGFTCNAKIKDYLLNN
ncbi:hypothetical protein HOC80_03015 [archaeon]|jgi:predicted choloylglycine hydrolase|nr:hypothetical protein [archaeon]MBT4417050.1 hypothetical protein [archaeon]